MCGGKGLGAECKYASIPLVYETMSKIRVKFVSIGYLVSSVNIFWVGWCVLRQMWKNKWQISSSNIGYGNFFAGYKC